MPFSGKAKPAQFGKTKGGASPKGFKQTTPKTATAAMQGRPPQGGKTKADSGPRKDAKRQFSKAGGKAVF